MQRISYTKQNTTLQQVFLKSKASRIQGLYSDQNVNGQLKINVDFKNSELDQVMETLLKART
ncbi:hypothetical protein CS542_07675 [Pedobacter sp. IW39]|nr:hypothetical protein CS542_07675 [Pedobacter sp. IW39]